MTTKKQHTRKHPVRTVEVLKGRDRYTVPVRAARPVVDPRPELEPEPDDQLEGELEDREDDGSDEPRAFEPMPQDDRDFRWFFSLGRKSRPKGLSPDRAKRWSRIHRCLDGRGRALCLHYTNPTATELAFAPAVAEPFRYFGSKLDGLNTTGACDLFVRRVIGRRAVAPRVDRRVLYQRQREQAEDLAFDRVRQLVVYDLEVEYGLYLQRKAKPRMPPTMADVFGLEEVRQLLTIRCGGMAIVEELFLGRGPGLEIATWGGVRIEASFAQHLLKQTHGLLPLQEALPALRETLGRGAEAIIGYRDIEEEDEREDVTVGQQESGLRGNRRKNLKAMNALARSGDAALKYLGRIERGSFDKKARRWENDPRLHLSDPGRQWTNVDEMSTAANVPPALARRLLVELGCPNARTAGARLPLAWFQGPAGTQFFRRVAAMPLEPAAPSSRRQSST